MNCSLIPLWLCSTLPCYHFWDNEGLVHIIKWQPNLNAPSLSPSGWRLLECHQGASQIRVGCMIFLEEQWETQRWLCQVSGALCLSVSVLVAEGTWDAPLPSPSSPSVPQLCACMSACVQTCQIKVVLEHGVTAGTGLSPAEITSRKSAGSFISTFLLPPAVGSVTWDRVKRRLGQEKAHITDVTGISFHLQFIWSDGS